MASSLPFSAGVKSASRILLSGRNGGWGPSFPFTNGAGACYNEASIPVDAGGVRSAGRAQRDGSSAERPFHASGFGRSPAEGRARGSLWPPVRGGLRPLLRFEAKVF